MTHEYISISFPVEEGKVDQASRDATGTALELIKGLSSHIVKELLFNRATCCNASHQHLSGADMEVENAK